MPHNLLPNSPAFQAVALERAPPSEEKREGGKGGGIELCDIQTRALLRSARPGTVIARPPPPPPPPARREYMLTAVVMMQFDIEIGPSASAPLTPSALWESE